MSSKNLPSDIIEAILVLLPAISLHRFKSVSKTWNSLISDPRFIKTHLNRQTKKLIAVSLSPRSLFAIDIRKSILENNNYDIPATANKLSSTIKWEEILGSCNGLVLAKAEKDTIYIINPTSTQEDAMWKVPPCPFTPPFHATAIYVTYGFGYDSSSDDYKILYTISSDAYKKTFVIILYSLRYNSWRKASASYSHYDEPVSIFRGAFVNHSLHWLSRSLTRIIRFNLANEEIIHMNLPDHESAEGPISFWHPNVYDIGGKVGLFRFIGDVGVECYVMEEYGVSESWTKIFIPTFELCITNFDPVCLIDREFVFGHFTRGVVAYSKDDKRLRGLGIVGRPILFKGTYVESLESPKRIITPAN